MIKISPFSYEEGRTPVGYICCKCDKTGIKLYREYQTFLDYQTLYCQECALVNQKMKEPDGKHTVGWLVAAVPTEDGSTFWGYTSVPTEGVIWWDKLPV